MTGSFYSLSDLNGVRHIPGLMANHIFMYLARVHGAGGLDQATKVGEVWTKYTSKCVPVLVVV